MPVPAKFHAKKRWWILACLTIAGVAMALWLWPQPEPAVSGKPLSEWIQQSMVGKIRAGGAERTEARVVVGGLGTNYVPLLLKWLDEEPQRKASFAEKFGAVRRNVAVWLMRHQLISGLTLPRWVSPGRFRLDHQTLALWAIPQLRNEARTKAIAELVKRLADTREWTMGISRELLVEMSPESVDPLIKSLDNPDPQVRVLAADALGDIGPAAAPAIKPLLRTLLDTNEEVAATAQGSLNKMNFALQDFTPERMRIWARPDSLQDQLDLLMRFPERAHFAVPVLEGMLKQLKDLPGTTNDLADEIMEALAAIRQREAADSARSGKTNAPAPDRK